MCPIRYNLLPDAKTNGELENELLSCTDIKYWFKFLQENAALGFPQKIHGSHDYRYENIMGKLCQLGFHSGIDVFHKCCLMYLEIL